MEGRSRKISTLIFLFAVFILLSVLVGSWLYKIYKEQTTYSQEQTLAAVDCGRYYFMIDEETVGYDNGTISFMMENTIGKDIKSLTLESALETKTLNVTGLSTGAMILIETPLKLTDWLFVYPSACRGINFKNISFEPNIPG